MNLLWTISYGKKFQNITHKFLQSIITLGNWKDDIVVLSDSPFNSIPNIQNFLINDSLKKYDIPLNCKYSAWFSKTLITEFVDITKYNNVLFCDSDVLVFKPILEYLSLLSQDFFWTSYDKKGNPNPKLCKVNSGVLWFSPRIFPNIIQEWKNIMPEYKNNKYIDQDALKFIIKNNYNSKLNHFHPHLISLKQKKEDSILVHYFHRYMHNFQNDWNKYGIT